MKKIQRLSLADKVALFLILVLALGAIGIYQGARQVQQKELLKSARGIASLVEGLLEATDKSGGFWVLKNKNLKMVARANGVNEKTGDEIEFFRPHDPDLVNYIANLASSSRIKLTFNWRKFSSQEKWELQKGTFRYEKPLVVKKSCISCHETTKGAPALRPGETAGALQVTFLDQGLLNLWGKTFFLGGVISFFIITVFLYGLIRFELLTPLSNLTQKVREMSLGNLDIDLGVSGLVEDQTRDEITKLAISIERLRKSQKTMEKMLDDDSLLL